jgi:hypothetical protein
MIRHKRRARPLVLHREVLRSLHADVAAARGGGAAVLDPLGGGGVSLGPSLWSGLPDQVRGCPPGFGRAPREATG